MYILCSVFMRVRAGITQNPSVISLQHWRKPIVTQNRKSWIHRVLASIAISCVHYLLQSAVNCCRLGGNMIIDIFSSQKLIRTIVKMCVYNYIVVVSIHATLIIWHRSVDIVLQRYCLILIYAVKLGHS